MNGPKVRLFLGIAIAGFHLGISLLFVLFGREIINSSTQVVDVIAMVLIYVQGSLLGTWAILGAGPYWARTPPSFLLLLWSGYSVSCSVPPSAQSELFVVISLMGWGQFFSVAGLILSVQFLLKLLKLDSHLDSSTKFSMSTMLIVVTFIAIALGTGKFIVQQLGVTIDVIAELDERLWMILFFITSNSVVVVMMLPGLWMHRWKWKLILLLPLLSLVGLISVIENILINDASTPWFILPILNVGQAIVFYITMFPLWRWQTKLEEENPATVGDEVINEELKGVNV
ncbi:MAG: hypothetical protein COA78_26700 [Blastopirellula sp.]|nr:MAG: hypothetical protein COA78_26700 [Blastopirellula sp.]